MGMLTHLILLTKDKGMFGLKKTLRFENWLKCFFVLLKDMGVFHE